MSQNQTCPFCKKTLTTPFCLTCAEVFYPILANLAKKQTNEIPPLQNIDNLVFQGGGVKGVAYLGVMDYLGDEFLSKVKRIAGTSAGSMCALYLGLGKNRDELYDLIYNKNFADLLDEGEQLKVHWPFHTLYFYCRDVILAATKFLLDSPEITKNPEIAKKKIVDIIGYVLYYLSGKAGFLAQAGVGVILPLIKRWIKKWLEKTFAPLLEETQKQPNQETITFEGFEKYIDEVFEDEMKKLEVEEDYQIIDFAEQEGIIEVDPDTGKPATDPSKLKDEKILTYAVTELIYTCLVGDGNNFGDQTFVGLFSADKIKEQLLTSPIAKSLQKIGKQNQYKAEDITFKELSELRNQSGDLAFRPFYVTSFNTSTLRTEVFSVDHTPNVVVADAVRASMSIPIFFKAVTIRERLPGQQELAPRKSYSSPTDKGTPILYVDGGLLDNYPIWIFDDLKYCADGQIPKWTPKRRIGIQNPNTLGFRILPEKRIDIYLKPYYDDLKEKLKNVSQSESIKNYIDMIKMIALTDFNEPQENEFVEFGEIPRTVYVDDMNISGVNFNLDEKDKEKLIDSGFAAVADYLRRAKNCFNDEI